MRRDRAASQRDAGQVSVPDLFDLDTPPSAPTRRRRPVARKLTLRVLTLVVAAFVLGVLTNAVVFHFGHRTESTGVVIGQQVNRAAARQHNPAGPKTPPTTAAPITLTWSSPVAFDAANAPQAVSCVNSTFCAAVDAHGRAVMYEGGQWAAPVDIDGNTPINAVSCPVVGFCVAVDQAGNAITYYGTAWSRPTRIDRNTFDELTSVSCATPTFCAAVDGDGYATIFTGVWSTLTAVDLQGSGAGPVSRDVASVSCPAVEFCVGTDPSANAFYFVGNSWQPAFSIDPSATPPSVKYKSSVTCATTTFCVATQNLGQVILYNGTQWSASVPIDPTNFLSSVSCPDSGFCAAVDGLLPEGFSTGNGSGEVITYNGINWSAPSNIDPGGILQSISCPTRHFCMAVDQAGRAVTGNS